MDRSDCAIPKSRSPVAYHLAVVSICLGAVVAALVVVCARMSVSPSPLAKYILLLSVMAVLHWHYEYRRPCAKLALLTGATAIMFSASLFAGIIANAALRLRFPLADPAFFAWDGALGVDTVGLVRLVADERSLAHLLAIAYSSIYPLTFCTAILLAITGERKRLWTFVFGFAAPLQLAAIISIFWPALGNIAYNGLHDLVGTGLPDGSGVYHLEAVHRYCEGMEPILDLSKLDGVVTFPSFHAVMALIVAHAFHGRGLVGWLVAAWCSLVMISTVPIGGHYIIDLFAGAFLLFVILFAARHLDGFLADPSSRTSLVKIIQSSGEVDQQKSLT